MHCNLHPSSFRLLLSSFRLSLRRLFLYLLAWIGRCLVSTPPSEELPSHILIIKPDHLGDVLLCTPALRMLRQSFPHAHIVILVGDWSACVLEQNPDVDELLTLPFPGFQRSRGRHLSLAPYLLLLRFALLLRAGHFDAALFFRDDHWWGAALAMLAGIPQRVGHAVPECLPFLTDVLPWNPDEHVTDQAITVVQRLIPTPSTVVGQVRASVADHVWLPDARAPTACIGQGLPYPVHTFNPSFPGKGREMQVAAWPLRFTPCPADVAWATGWLAEHGVRAEHCLIILHPGTGGTAKLWLSDRWAAIANQLATDPTVRLLLTGGAGEETLVQSIVQLLHRPPLVLVGATSVGQLAALLGQAALVLGVDSGPLHLAVSQDTPSLHLFGPSNAERFGPWGDPTRHRVLCAGLWCSPCGIFSACPRHTAPPECMDLLTVEQVVETGRQLLTRT